MNIDQPLPMKMQLLAGRGGAHLISVLGRQKLEGQPEFKASCGALHGQCSRATGGCSAALKLRSSESEVAAG